VSFFVVLELRHKNDSIVRLSLKSGVDCGLVVVVSVGVCVWMCVRESINFYNFI